MVVIILYLALAAFFNAFMDATENTPNFNESILKHLDKKFWCKDVSWAYSKKIFGYRFDAWHISKTLMVLCILSAFYFALLNEDHYDLSFYWWGLFLITGGIVWNVTFTLTYHGLLKVK